MITRTAELKFSLAKEKWQECQGSDLVLELAEVALEALEEGAIDRATRAAIAAKDEAEEAEVPQEAKAAWRVFVGAVSGCKRERRNTPVPKCKTMGAIPSAKVK